MYDACLRILVFHTRTYLGTTCLMTGLHGREVANASIASLTSLHPWWPPKNWQNVSPLLLFHIGQLKCKRRRKSSIDGKSNIVLRRKTRGGSANHSMERAFKWVQSTFFKLHSWSKHIHLSTAVRAKYYKATSPVLVYSVKHSVVHLSIDLMSWYNYSSGVL